MDEVEELASEPSAEAFLRSFVKENRPVVLRGAVRNWRALNWSVEYVRRWDDEVVSVAPLQAYGEHAYCDKWLEDAALWSHREWQPESVNPQQLLVVNAARVHMPLRRFRSLLQPETSGVSASFYADGAGNLARYFSFLQSDFTAPPLGKLLELKRADLWVGGRSVSRMHFDNLDNLFAQIVGRKTFVLTPPEEGISLVHGRLRKAVRSYAHPGLFSREAGKVTDDTVINYLSTDRPSSLKTLSITLEPGDMLYLPFGWWHEVHGEGDPQRGGMCASISHFYYPYYCRIGACTTTELGPMLINPKYSKLEHN